MILSDSNHRYQIFTWLGGGARLHPECMLGEGGLEAVGAPIFFWRLHIQTDGWVSGTLKIDKSFWRFLLILTRIASHKGADHSWMPGFSLVRSSFGHTAIVPEERQRSRRPFLMRLVWHHVGVSEAVRSKPSTRTTTQMYSFYKPDRRPEMQAARSTISLHSFQGVFLDFADCVKRPLLFFLACKESL